MKAGLEKPLILGELSLATFDYRRVDTHFLQTRSLVVSGELSVLKPPCLMVVTLRYTNIAMEKSP